MQSKNCCNEHRKKQIKEKAPVELVNTPRNLTLAQHPFLEQSPV
jgi:hypothetical protein